jgi:peroxiredoxin
MSSDFMFEIALGSLAPEFSLPAPDGVNWSLPANDNLKGILVIFASTRCPFMRHIVPGVVDFAREYAEKGVATIAINVNSGETLDDIAAETAKYNYPFPYVKDVDQKVAAAYMASCTPDFFLFGADRRLFYHGQFDDSSPASPLPVTGSDLREATEALLAGQSAPEDQKYALGACVAWNDEPAPGACAAE